MGVFGNFPEQPRKIGVLGRLGQIGGLGGIAASLGGLLAFLRKDAPQFNLPEQQFGAQEAGQIASRFGTQLKRSGASSLERTGLETPSRFLSVQAQAGNEQAGLLANLLRQVDQMALQRSVAEFQAGALGKEFETKQLSALTDITGLLGHNLLFGGDTGNKQIRR